MFSRLSAVIVIAAFAVPLPAAAFTQADADACTPDAMRLCQNAVPDPGRVAKCLYRKKRQLSTACANVFNREQSASRSVRDRRVRIRRADY
jgi:hypothetical protein